MAYTKPTAAEFKAVFPSFGAVGDATIVFALDEADSRADETWPDADRVRGVMLYAAHVLTLDGHGAGNEAKLIGFSRIKSALLELERSAGSSSASAGSLGSTSFGVRYLALVRRLFPAVLVV